MKQIQTLDLSTATLSPGAENIYLKQNSGFSYSQQFACWWGLNNSPFLKFNLYLPYARGVNFIATICSAMYNGSLGSSPVTITVNSNPLVTNYPNTNSSFWDMAWYIPPTMLKAGNNDITISLGMIGNWSSNLMVRKIAINMFEMEHQMQDNWCWSGVATSTSLYYNCASGWTQGKLANQALTQTSCCLDGSTPQCNKPWSLSGPLGITGNLVSGDVSPQTFNVVQSQANSGLPLGARTAWSPTSAHFVIISGVNVINGVQMVAIEDPWSGPSFIPFATFCTQYQGSGTWSHSYFTKSN